jgi:hypothetical protein
MDQLDADYLSRVEKASDLKEARAVDGNKSNFSKLNKFFDDTDKNVVRIKTKIQEKNQLIRDEYMRRCDYKDKNYSNLKLGVVKQLRVKKVINMYIYICIYIHTYYCIYIIYILIYIYIYIYI